MEVARLLAATKKSPTNVELFYTLKKVEKKPNLTVELFIPCDAVKKRPIFR